MYNTFYELSSNQDSDEDETEYYYNRKVTL